MTGRWVRRREGFLWHYADGVEAGHVHLGCRALMLPSEVEELIPGMEPKVQCGACIDEERAVLRSQQVGTR